MKQALLFLWILGIGLTHSNGATVYSNDKISQAVKNLSNRAQQVEIEQQRQQADYERMVSDYERRLAESEQEIQRQIENSPNPRIGMTQTQVAYESNWGLPDSTNTNGKFELWIYDNGKYLYFTNDKLTSIHD